MVAIEHPPSPLLLLPTVVRAEYQGGYRIFLVFNDGVESTVDFSGWLPAWSSSR
jgi:hypothetical protein